jgi:hypothetical protein
MAKASNGTGPVYQGHVGGLVLWRDGNKAVVSIKLYGQWIRAAEADCRGLFHETCDVADLLDMTWQAELARRDRRANLLKEAAG